MKPCSGRRLRPADALPRMPVGDRGAQALPQRLRAAPGAFAPTRSATVRVPKRRPAPAPRRASSGSTSRRVDRRTAYHYAHHPFDVVGWDGYLWPLRVQHRRLRADHRAGSTSRRPVHQTFAARNFVVCSFVPRKFDYHPLAIPAPYNHSNINSDEVIYYVAGNFMSRRGVEDRRASRSTRPGIPHGPRPRARPRRRSARRRPRSWR